MKLTFAVTGMTCAARQKEPEHDETREIKIRIGASAVYLLSLMYFTMGHGDWALAQTSALNPPPCARAVYLS